MSKAELIELVLSLSSQMTELNQKIDLLIEQIAVSNNARFGKSSEAGLIDENQLRFFNETEALANSSIPEPDIEIVVPSYKRKKQKGKLDEDLSAFPSEIVGHYFSEDELKEKFPDGYSTLPDEIYRKLEYKPATYKVLEHHIGVYKDKRSGEIIKFPHPVEMLNKSIATPSLASAIINAKYTNAVPLYRIEQDFERNDIHISRQTMANWMIVLSERYLSLIYDRLKDEILRSSVIHADETPVLVTKDGREGTHKSYMWVFRTGTMCKANTSIVYEYQKTRQQEHPMNFLKGFGGKLVCDGYQVYHGIEKETDITVSGCWAHARRDFAENVKAIGKEKAVGTLAYEALAKIMNIYYVDKPLLKFAPSERKRKRKLLVKPLVDDFFSWIRIHQNEVLPKSKTGEGFAYCLNQEQYLRSFLNDPNLPMDNNAAEQAIRPFCIGKNNWRMIDTVHGAKASAMLYSIVETAKANELRIYDYFEYLLSEIPRHMDGTDLNFVEDLMPWSKSLPEFCRKSISNLKK